MYHRAVCPPLETCVMVNLGRRPFSFICFMRYLFLRGILIFFLRDLSYLFTTVEFVHYHQPNSMTLQFERNLPA